VGQAYGGMVAADLAANFPPLFSRLVLLSPLGLWRDGMQADQPEAAWTAVSKFLTA
jgi:pimeloyl-ACP methyl ester carboxylesterase